MKPLDWVLVGAFAFLLLNPIGATSDPNPAQTTLQSWQGLVGQGMLDIAEDCRSGEITTEYQFYSASNQRSKDAFNIAWRDGIAKAMDEAFPREKDADGNEVSTWTPERAAEIYQEWGTSLRGE